MNFIYSLLVVIFLQISQTVLAEDECQKDEDCKDVLNPTQSSCCHRKFQSSVCREICIDESCIISWDCGTAQELFCCSNHACASSSEKCPSHSAKLPVAVTVVVALSVTCAVLGIGGVMIYIYIRHRRRLQVRGCILVEEPVTY